MYCAVFVGLDCGRGRDFITEGAALDSRCLKRLPFERLRWNCQLMWLTGLMTSLSFLLHGTPAHRSSPVQRSNRASSTEKFARACVYSNNICRCTRWASMNSRRLAVTLTTLYAWDIDHAREACAVTTNEERRIQRLSGSGPQPAPWRFACIT